MIQKVCKLLGMWSVGLNRLPRLGERNRSGMGQMSPSVWAAIHGRNAVLIDVSGP